MNVSFIGCPSSGKTTTAAMVFAKLKEGGLPAEFVPEYARIHIAKKRLALNLPPEEKLTLTDDDQVSIMFEQEDLEWTMSQVCGPKVVVISDTWSLAALLYMSPDARAEEGLRYPIYDIASRSDLVFYAPPVTQTFILDPNRVHDEQQSLAVDALIPEILARYAPSVKAIRLSGSPEMRAAQVLSEIYQKLRAL